MNRHLDPTLKHDAIVLFDAIDSNPNGDPDNGGAPRIDVETGQGIVSDASLKRKIRDIVEFQVNEGVLPADAYKIFIRRGVSLNEQLEEAWAADGHKPDKKAPKAHEEAAQKRMKAECFDVRLFGAVMSTGNASGGKLTGPVSVGIARSFHPVAPIELAITRTASTREEAKDNASQMGSKSVVPYGLYAFRVHYQPTKDNAVTARDLEVFWHALAQLFEVTRSAARPDVNVRSITVFTHDNPLGNAPARTLLDRVRVNLRAGCEQPRSFDDYTVTTPEQAEMPSGVTVTQLV